MISARSGRSDVTDILVEGEHIDLDIQENVRICNHVHVHTIYSIQGIQIHIQGIHIHIHTCTCTCGTCVYRYKCTYLQCSSYTFYHFCTVLLDCFVFVAVLLPILYIVF